MRKRTILTVGDVILEEEVYKSDFIGGKIYATNTKTGDVYTETWKKMHGGRTNRWAVMANCVAAVAPQPDADTSDEGNTTPTADLNEFEDVTNE